MKRLKLALICLTLLWSTTGYAGEALVTKVRGSKLAIDTGAEAGLTAGMEITIVRPPGETITHPYTGEDLGAPEIEIGRGTISKTSNRASSVQLEGDMLMRVRPGDIVRFITPEEEMIMDQERTTASQERNQKEHQGFRNDVSRLTRGLKDIQKRIGSLESLMKRVERVEDGFRVQLRGIQESLITMKEDIGDLKDQVALYGPVPAGGMEGEQKEGAGGLDLTKEEDVDQLKNIIREVVEDARVEMPAQTVDAPLTEDDLILPAEGGEDDELAIVEEEEPFYTKSWFFGIIGAIGIIAVAGFFYLRMMAGSEEDEEDEEDEEIEEDDDEDEELEIEVEEEEDDIVVEETS